jgi:hypothetical protein
VVNDDDPDLERARQGAHPAGDWFDDLPELHAEPMHDTSLPTLKQVEARLAGRFGPMTRWALLVGLLVDHRRAHHDLLGRLALWPVQARQHRMADDPAEARARAADRAERTLQRAASGWRRAPRAKAT